MLYKYFQSVQDTDKLIYFGLVVVISLIVVRFNPSWTVIAGIVFGTIIVFYLADRKMFLSDSYLYRMLNILNSPDVDPKTNTDLYLDAQLADFLHGIREYRQYNPALYRDIVHQCNNFLKLQREIEQGTQHYQIDFRNLRHQKYKILNLYQSSIVSMPNTGATNDKYQQGLETLKDILNRHIDKVQRFTIDREQEQGVTIQSDFVYLKAPHGVDPEANPHYDYFSQSD